MGINFVHAHAHTSMHTWWTYRIVWSSQPWPHLLYEFSTSMSEQHCSFEEILNWYVYTKLNKRVFAIYLPARHFMLYAFNVVLRYLLIILKNDKSKPVTAIPSDTYTGTPNRARSLCLFFRYNYEAHFVLIDDFSYHSDEYTSARKENGAVGALAISFSNLLKEMWSEKHSLVKPNELKVLFHSGSVKNNILANVLVILIEIGWECCWTLFWLLSRRCSGISYLLAPRSAWRSQQTLLFWEWNNSKCSMWSSAVWESD